MSIGMQKQPSVLLRRCNTILSIVVLLLGLYIVCLPLLPNIAFWAKKATHSSPPLVAQTINPQPNTPEIIPTENTLVIPSLNMQEVVHEGQTAATLRYGVWRRPQTSDPSKDSNTVIVGHRFTYTDPQGVFYSLDKVEAGDPIFMYWQGKKYTYSVTRVFVVPPTATEIERPTDKPRLTLYTCTPLWSAHDRLVVQASLLEQKP